MIALSFASFALASFHWILIGYSLAFGPDVGGFIGNLDYIGLDGVSADAGTGTFPPLVFMIFQLFDFLIKSMNIRHLFSVGCYL